MARKDEALSHGDRPSKQPHGSGDRNAKTEGGAGSTDNESSYGGSPSLKATEKADKKD